MPRREVQMKRMKRIWLQNLKRTAVLEGPGLAPDTVGWMASVKVS
jgi:hypothetical protein